MIVAKGVVHPLAKSVHNTPLRPDHACVQVELVVDGWQRVPLPVPTDDAFVLDDARMSFVQWPKSQIVLDQVIHKKIHLFCYIQLILFEILE